MPDTPRPAGLVKRKRRPDAPHDLAADLASIFSSKKPRDRGMAAAITTIGASTLWGAAANGDLAAVARLVDTGPIDAAGLNGATPLHIAAECGFCDVVEYLAEEGADLNTRDDDGNTPLHIAVRLGDELMRRDKESRTLVFTPVSADLHEVVQLLINDDDVDIDATNNDLQTPLYVAARQGAFVAVQLLLDAGADIDKVADNGKTPLMIARLHKKRPAVRAILETVVAEARDADTNRKCRDSWVEGSGVV